MDAQATPTQRRRRSKRLQTKKPPLSSSSGGRPRKLARRVSSLENHTPDERRLDALHCEAAYRFYVTRDTDSGEAYVLLLECTPAKDDPPGGWRGSTTAGSDMARVPTWTVPGGETPHFRGRPLPFLHEFFAGKDSTRAPEEWAPEGMGANVPASEAEAVEDAVAHCVGALAAQHFHCWATECNEVRRLDGRYVSKRGRRSVIKLESLSHQDSHVHWRDNWRHWLTERLDEEGDPPAYQRPMWIALDGFVEAVEEAAAQLRLCEQYGRDRAAEGAQCWVTDDRGRALPIALAPPLVKHIMGEFQTLPEFREFLTASIPTIASSTPRTVEYYIQ